VVLDRVILWVMYGTGSSDPMDTGSCDPMLIAYYMWKRIHSNIIPAEQFFFTHNSSSLWANINFIASHRQAKSVPTYI